MISLGRHYLSFSQNGKREVNAYDGNRSISNTRYGRPLEDQKTPAGETEYVVSFYDPNATNTAVRYKANNCDSFGSLQSFINIQQAKQKWVITDICSECVGITLSPSGTSPFIKWY